MFSIAGFHTSVPAFLLLQQEFGPEKFPSLKEFAELIYKTTRAGVSTRDAPEVSF
jgi:hypothetical protein